MLQLVKKFACNINDEGFLNAIQTTRIRVQTVIGNNIISNLPSSLLYWYFEIRKFLKSDYSDTNPMKVVWVKPDFIKYYCNSQTRFGLVADGEWDRDAINFNDIILYRSIKKRILHNTNWEETEWYQWIKDNPLYMNSRGIYHLDDLEHYFSRIDDLIHSLKVYGYKTQDQLLKEGHVPRDVSSDNPHILLNEITVNIFRDGSLGKRASGNHRLTIAKILPEIEKIPVLIRVRHTKWQNIRNEIKNTRSVNELRPAVKKHLSHPDLQDIVPNNWLNNCC